MEDPRAEARSPGRRKPLIPKGTGFLFFFSDWHSRLFDRITGSEWTDRMGDAIFTTKARRTQSWGCLSADVADGRRLGLLIAD
jgi:hypothetical protein